MGHVSLRSQVRTQVTIAQQQGATLITATVNALHESTAYIEVRTDTGHIYRAEKVLLATGGFSNT